MDIHPHAVAASPALPAAGQVAVAEYRDLHRTLADNPRLTARAIRAIYRRPLPDAETALAVVVRRLSDRLVRHILDAGEDRPVVVGALAAVNAPRAPDLRERILAVEGPGVSDGVLHNPRWTNREQARVAEWGSGPALLGWLARLDPATDGDVVEDILSAWPTRGAEAHGDKLHAAPAVVLRAAVRWPQLFELPAQLVGPGLRSVTGTLSRDPRVLHRLLDEATVLGRGGWGVEAATLIEAIAVNPHASLRVQHRASRLARTVVPCPYLEGWRPEPAASPGTAGGGAYAGRVLDAVERNTRARHRTVWSAVQLALSADGLDEPVAARLVRYLTLHGRAAGLDPATVGLVLDRHAVGDDERQQLLEAPWHEEPRHLPWSVPLRATPGPSADRREHQEHADGQVRRLAQLIGAEAEAWSLSVLLLREGWDRDVDELATVVGQLVIAEGSAA